MTDGWDEREVADLEDEYELLGELGRGASAIVYRARDRFLGRLVAIKVVRPHSIAAGSDALVRLAREAKTVARLHHPHIVIVHAVQRLSSGGLALVMQLVPGRTLKQAIEERGPFPPEEAERILREIASALACAHAHGVVHRDVKPENIFLDAETGRAMLSDFGIALSTDQESRLTMTGAAIGTPAYMAPEQIDGGCADARSDVYSLGLVAWEMLTGRRPWDGESLYNVITKQRTEDLPAIDALRPGVVPERLQYVVERMLQKRPAARWAGADALLAKLDQWVVPSDWPQWQASHRRRRAAAARAERAPARAGQAPGASPAMATIRFRRAEDGGEQAGPAGDGASDAARDAAGAHEAVDPDAATPSWALEAPAPARRVRAVVAVAAALVVLGAGGALAWTLRSDRGGAAGRVGGGEAAVATTGAPRVPGEIPVARDTQAGRLADAALAADSAPAAPLPASGNPAAGNPAAGNPAAGSPAAGLPGADRQQGTPVPVLSADGAPASRPVRRRAPAPSAIAAALASDSADSAASAALVRATDDRGLVAAGGRHSCTLGGGRAFCWGANDRGQLGDGELETRDAPTPVVGDLVFVQLAAGLAHTCGIARGGEAYCWGAGDRGQLGDATTTSRSAPVRVAGSAAFRLVRTGNSHSCGLTTAGDVLCWGANENGQLGDGGAGARATPVRVTSDRRFVSLAAGWNHSCAIATDGSVWCWGANGDGQLGTGGTGDQRTPQPVASSLRFTAIAAGGSHTCAVSEDGEAWCWGRNANGQLGTGGTAPRREPARVASSARVVSVSLGGVHSCARASSGQAWCWGRNVYGQLGDGTTTDRDTPVRVAGGASFAALSVTGAHSCGATTAGEVSCWGFNVQGQLGDGTRNHLARPSRVPLPGP